MARQLATIRKINKILPIEGKDKIVLACVDGWQAIVQKDLFKEDDLVIFCEPDSVLPEKPEYEFLSKYNYRIRTIKMAGVISQGVVFPLSQIDCPNPEVGMDVTEQMGIHQYEPLMDTDPKPRGKKKSWLDRLLMRFEWYRKWTKGISNHGEFPNFIKKTDEERIQNCPGILESDRLWIGTEKVDGCSATYFLKRHGFLCFHWYEFGVCSRNLRLTSDDGSHYWEIAHKYHLHRVLSKLIQGKEWAVIQGEILGPGIQKNIYKLTEHQFRVYSIIFPTGRLNSSDSSDLAGKYGLLHVPLVTNAHGISLKGLTVQDMLEKATGESLLCGNPTLREGIVYRDTLGEASFKAVSPTYLLKHEA